MPFTVQSTIRPDLDRIGDDLRRQYIALVRRSAERARPGIESAWRSRVPVATGRMLRQTSIAFRAHPLGGILTLRSAFYYRFQRNVRAIDAFVQKDAETRLSRLVRAGLPRLRVRLP